jgi:putative DNA primase/helicase
MKVNRALAYANMGWDVFPLTPNTKIPLPGSSGFKDATKDKVKIQAWWDRTPDANIGIATGQRSGIVVLDVDVKNGSPGQDSLKRISGLHPTLIAKTPTGGWHYVYAYDKKCDSRGGFMPGLDFKADGGYIVGAGSEIDGVFYEWVDADYPLAPLPDVLKTLIVKQRDDAPLWKVLEEGKPITLLHRNTTLASIAGLYRWSGMAKPEIYAAIDVINKKRCQPPLPQKDVDTIVNSITKYAPTEFKKSMEEIESSDDDRFLHYEEYLKLKESEAMEFRYRLPGCRQLDHFLDGIQPGELIVITGPKGNGKTLFSRTLGY